MRYFFLISLLLSFSVSCQKKHVVFTEPPTELFVGYALAGDNLHTVRLFKNGEVYELHRAVLLAGVETMQQSQPIRRVPPDSIAATKSILKTQYHWRPFATKEPAVLFVQVAPSQEHREESALDLITVMNERGAIEDAIDEELQKQNLGESVASDLGPGGINILYEVTNPTAALPVIIQVLEARQIQHRSRIAHRLMTAVSDWRYEVVYPLSFSGKFNSM